MKNTMKNVLVQSARDVYNNLKFIFLFWGTNAVFALLLTLPLYRLLNENLNRSLIGSSLTHDFNYTWFLQFSNIFKSNIDELPYLIIAVTAIYTLIQTFFLGGLISVFHFPKKNHFTDFFYGSVKYWYRFLKVLIVSIVLYAALFILNDYLGDLISFLFVGNGNELAEIIIRSLRYLLLIFLIGMVTMISDYTKVSLALADREKVFSEIKSVLVLMKKNFYLIFNIFLFVALLGAVGSVIYNFLEALIPSEPVYFLILAFVLQQMLVIFRLYIRMFFYSTEVNIYKDIVADFAAVDISDDKTEIKK
ncbi:MAG: hypothetical protein GXO87_03605 [Chlorobi bacterium]|nr:hypothetical protein [Chlorobiota bacterium]